VQEWKTSFDNLSSLQSLGHIKLEGVKSNFPVLPDFVQSIIDDLANTCSLTNLHQDRLILWVFLKHEFGLVLVLFLFPSLLILWAFGRLYPLN